jgi:hypothetical protein
VTGWSLAQQHKRITAAYYDCDRGSKLQARNYNSNPQSHFPPAPPQRGRDLDSKTSKQASSITHVAFKACPEHALGFVKWKSRSAPASSGSSSTALGGAGHAECPPPARQRRSIASFARPRLAVWPHRRRVWWMCMALTARDADVELLVLVCECVRSEVGFSV